ncbi:hypothetical protein MferCBS31731_005607 [Microsporum ferrugineum]
MEPHWSKMGLMSRITKRRDCSITAGGQSLVDVKPPSHLTGDIRPQRVVNSTLTGFEGFLGAKLFARSCSAGYCMIVILVWKIKEQNATRDTTASSLLAAVRQAIGRAAASTAMTPRKTYAVTTEGAVPSPAPVIRTEDVVLTTNWSAAKRMLLSICCTDGDETWSCGKGESCCTASKSCYLPETEKCCESGACPDSGSCWGKECCDEDQRCGLDGYCMALPTPTTATVTETATDFTTSTDVTTDTIKTATDFTALTDVTTDLLLAWLLHQAAVNRDQDRIPTGRFRMVRCRVVGEQFLSYSLRPASYWEP